MIIPHIKVFIKPGRGWTKEGRPDMILYVGEHGVLFHLTETELKVTRVSLGMRDAEVVAAGKVLAQLAKDINRDYLVWRSRIISQQQADLLTKDIPAMKDLDSNYRASFRRDNFMPIWNQIPATVRVQHNLTNVENLKKALASERNDSCFCGSGKKWKKCCRSFVD